MKLHHFELSVILSVLAVERLTWEEMPEGVQILVGNPNWRKISTHDRLNLLKLQYEIDFGAANPEQRTRMQQVRQRVERVVHQALERRRTVQGLVLDCSFCHC